MHVQNSGQTISPNFLWDLNEEIKKGEICYQIFKNLNLFLIDNCALQVELNLDPT